MDDDVIGDLAVKIGEALEGHEMDEGLFALAMLLTANADSDDDLADQLAKLAYMCVFLNKNPDASPIEATHRTIQ